MEKVICDQFCDDVDTFQQWVKSQPQLPQNMSKI